MQQEPPPASTAAVQALCNATHSGNARQLRALLRGAANPHALLMQIHDGLTALHAAASQGHIPCMEILLATGCAEQQVLAVDVVKGWTALMHASFGGHSACVSLLLAAGDAAAQIQATSK